MTPDLDKIYLGDCTATMRGWPSDFVQTCITSPPYLGLRDYGHDEQIGLEPTPQEYVDNLVAVFREVKRVLRNDGTLWLNLGDSYNNYAGNRGPSKSLDKNRHAIMPARPRCYGLQVKDLKNKDLIGIPWMVAFALRADGWYLRQDIVWAKPNPMPESVTDRCTKSHEYLFLLAKSDRYYYDQESIAETVALSTVGRMAQNIDAQASSLRVPGKTNGAMKAVLKRSGNRRRRPVSDRGVPIDTNGKTNGAVAGSVPWEGSTRNKRSVWTVTTRPFSEAHFATFPPDLITPCVLAGAPRGGVILDPFMGAGTTALVAATYSRRFIGCELNPEYIKIAERRIAQEVAQDKFL